MHEILRNLQANARVLDLGCRAGSFPPECCPGALIVRLDNSWPGSDAGPGFVQGDATCLPFANASFDAVIANHSLEHMHDLASVLKEISRVVRRDGSLYVAVPDESTLTDRIYRWISQGGGHVNAFRDAGHLSAQIAQATSLELTATRQLHSSLEFLRREHYGPRPPRKLWLFCNGNTKALAILNYVLRLADRYLGTRTSVYGWAFYFGEIGELIETAPWTNVCVGCGAGHPVAALMVNNRVRRQIGIFRSYNCPNCGEWNLYTDS
jgi:SAM-dependent methyltransferase